MFHTFQGIRRFAVTTLFVLLGISMGFAQQQIYLESGTQENYTYCPKAGSDKLVVFTLKHVSGNADFDLYIFSNELHTSKLGGSNVSGTATELVMLSPKSNSQCFFISVRNYQGNGTYSLYAHQVSFGEKLFLAFTRAALRCGLMGCPEESDDFTPEDLGKIGNIILKGLMQMYTGETSKEKSIDDLREYLANELGSGFWGDFAIDFVAEMVKGIFYHY